MRHLGEFRLSFVYYELPMTSQLNADLGALRRRLAGEHVQRRTRHFAAVECLQQVRFCRRRDEHKKATKPREWVTEW